MVEFEKDNSIQGPACIVATHFSVYGKKVKIAIGKISQCISSCCNETTITLTLIRLQPATNPRLP